MSDLTRLTAAETAAAIRDRSTSAVEVAQAHLDRIARVDGQVHAFLHVDAEGALAQATRVDAGGPVGRLLGPPAKILLRLPPRRPADDFADGVDAEGVA